VTNARWHGVSRATISSVVVACIVLAVLAALPGRSARAEPGPGAGLSIIGQLQLEPCAIDRKFAVASSLHMVVSVRHYDPACGPAGHLVGLDAYSTTNLDRVGSWTLELPDLTAGNNAGTLGPVAVDQDGHRAFVAFDDGHFGSRIAVVDLGHLDPGAGSVTPSAVYQAPGVPDANTAASTDDATGAAGTATYCAGAQLIFGGSGCLYVNGAYYDAATNSLDVMESPILSNQSAAFSTHGPQQPRVYLSRLDASSGQKRWMINLARCSVPLSATIGAQQWVPLPDPTMVFHSAGGDGVAAGCLFSHSFTRGSYGGTANASNAALAGGSMMTYIIPLKPDGSLFIDANQRVQSDSYIGRPNVLAGLPDPSSGRMFYAAAPPVAQTTVANAAGPTAIGFDISHHAYIGATTAGPPEDNAGGFNLAVAGGRIYSVGADGVIVGDTTSTPQGQGIRFPLAICEPGGPRAYVASLQADVATRRVFAWFTNCDDSNSRRPYLVVYQDSIPSLAQAATPNPDSYTQQVAEQPGMTQNQFGAHGEATGSRFRLIGGTTGLVKGGTAGGYDLALQQVPPGVQPPDAVRPQTQPDFATREMQLAYVRNADVSNYQATAQSLAAGSDTTTAEQLKSTATKQDWPFVPADCSSPGKEEMANTYGGDTKSSVDCDLSTHSASAVADAGPAGFTLTSLKGGLQAPPALPFLVGQSHGESQVTLDTAKGITSNTIAEARNVTAGPVFIRSIRSESHCVAHGRTGTATCTFTRTVNGVTNGGQAVGGGACRQVDGPAGATDTCAAMLAQLNAIDPGILVFSMPSPDGRAGFFDGSPGGYQAVAQRELYAHLEDNVLNYDGSVQVPGMQVVYNNDTPDTPSRLDMQLANVQSETHYGISQASSFEEAAPATLTDALPPVAAPVSLSAGRAATPGSPPGFFATLGKLIEQFLAGLSWLLRSPLQALLMAGMITLFSLPIYLAVRRRRLEALGAAA
jgi:hypothetical protein